MKVERRGQKRSKRDNQWGDRSENKSVDISCEVTINDPEDDAVHIVAGIRGVWLPRSRTTINDDGTVTIPRWLAIDRKLV